MRYTYKKPGKPDVGAKQKALDLLLYRTRTEKELHDKLLERGYSEEDTAEAVAYVKSYGYVDDADYARRYVSSHAADCGRNLIRRNLREKGIADEMIEEALCDLDTDETEILQNLIVKKYGSPHPLEEKEYRRIYGYLLRHGFGGGAVSGALRAYQEPGDEDY